MLSHECALPTDRRFDLSLSSSGRDDDDPSSFPLLPFPRWEDEQENGDDDEWYEQHYHELETYEERREREDREAREILRIKTEERRSRRSAMRAVREGLERDRIEGRRDRARVGRERRFMWKEDQSMREMMRRTRPFFAVEQLDPYGIRVKKVPLKSDDGGTFSCTYYGDAIETVLNDGWGVGKYIPDKETAWVPHGNGKYIVGEEDGKSGDGGFDGVVFYEGEFQLGRMHGRGSYTFTNGDRWINGTFHMNQLHGIGTYVLYDKSNGSSPSSNNRDAIYHHDRRVCFADELLPGVYVIFLSSTYESFHNSFKQYKNMRDRTGGIILGQGSKRGYYRIKLDSSDIVTLNLATGISFEISRSAVRVTHLQNTVLINEDPTTTAAAAAAAPSVSHLPNDETGGTRNEPSGTEPGRSWDGYLPAVPNATSSRDENWFAEDVRDAAEIREAAALHQRTRDEAAYRRHKTDSRANRDRAILEEATLRHREERAELERRLVRDAHLYEEGLRRRKEDLRRSREAEEAKILSSRNETEVWEYRRESDRMAQIKEQDEKVRKVREAARAFERGSSSRSDQPERS